MPLIAVMADDRQEFEERRKQSFWERVDAIEQECRRGHRALRQSVNELEAQVDALEHDIKHLAARIETVANAPVESTKIRFSTGILASLILVTVSIVGSAYGVSSNVTRKIDALSAKVNQQAIDDQKERDNMARLYDERNGRTLTAIDTLSRQQKLLEYELQRLREDVTKKGLRK